MNNLREDDKVIDLLSKLKNVNGVYPSPMFAARRRMYLKQMANVGLGLGLGSGLRHPAKSGGIGTSVTSATITSKILETALIAAIALEAGTVAYLYRNKIANAIKSYVNSPAVQQVISPSDDNSPSSNPELTEVTGTPLVTPTATPSGTPSATPSTELAGDNNQNNNGASNNGVNANATPNPNGNNGNQYGLTPKPERTRENNGGGDGGGEGGGNDGGGGGGNNGNGGSNNNP